MNKPVATLVLAVACASAWSAQAAAPAVDKLVACADEQDSRQRLACFDREIVPFARPRAASTIAPSPAPVPAPATVPRALPAPVPEPRRPSLGEEQLAPKLREAEPVDEQVLHAKVSSQRETSPGTYAVTLDNGQVWSHKEERQGSYLREGEAVTIRKGSLGSYRLTRDAGQAKNWIRVTRIR